MWPVKALCDVCVLLLACVVCVVTQWRALVTVHQCRRGDEGGQFGFLKLWKVFKIKSYFLTNGGDINAINCINIHSNCIIMQFLVDVAWRGAGCWWWEDTSGWTENIWNCILMFVTLHSKSCHFAPKCLLFLHCFLQWSFWKPNLQYFSFLYWMSYILSLRILHSLRKSTTFFTRIHFILYQNALHSRKECSWFSYWA